MKKDLLKEIKHSEKGAFLYLKGGEKMEITKTEITAEDLKLINKYSKTELKAEDVYTFKVACCDNQVDRDFESFSDKALFKMAELYVGKTIIKDHSFSTDNQLARIYKTAVETGENDVKRLVASAYVPISGSTKDFITAIESGIKKEVSVSCSVTSCVCSICGKNFIECNHQKSKKYDDSTCYVVLDDVSDVYELSFVAVPAQKNAGVIKSFKSYKPQPTEPQKEQKTDSILQLRLRLAKANEDNLTIESEEIDNESK